MNIEGKFKRLLEPGRIGQMEVRNRIVMPGMQTGLCPEDGYVTQNMKDYYDERARGGVGLIIVEITCVDYPRGKGFLYQIGVDDDKFIPGLLSAMKYVERHF